MSWDLLIIAFSLWNSLLVPFEFSIMQDEEGWKHWTLDIFDRTIDVLFIFDILITFRTILIDPVTGDQQVDWKRIAIKYVVFG